MFEGFDLDQVDVGEVTLRVRYGGAGAPIVLLHGHPRTHTTWHAVAPRLARHHFVVTPDLRGYGRSTLPPDAPDHAQSSKRAMARDVVQLMSHLGHDRFAVAGHDRGALVAFRAAMDHPDVVSHLVVMDGLPVIEHLERTDAQFARTWWHWWFLGQTDKPAERVICADPTAWYRTPDPAAMGEDNHADVWAALNNPAVVHGMCEDYRAGLGVDRDHDEGDRTAGRQVTCPTLLLESAHDDLDIHGDPAEIWAPGSPAHFATGPSTAATIRRRKRPSRWPRRCSTSSPNAGSGSSRPRRVSVSFDRWGASFRCCGARTRTHARRAPTAHAGRGSSW